MYGDAVEGGRAEGCATGKCGADGEGDGDHLGEGACEGACEDGKELSGDIPNFLL